VVKATCPVWGALGGIPLPQGSMDAVLRLQRQPQVWCRPRDGCGAGSLVSPEDGVRQPSRACPPTSACAAALGVTPGKEVRQPAGTCRPYRQCVSRPRGVPRHQGAPAAHVVSPVSRVLQPTQRCRPPARCASRMPCDIRVTGAQPLWVCHPKKECTSRDLGVTRRRSARAVTNVSPTYPVHEPRTQWHP
jgi:hypothetical protein